MKSIDRISPGFSTRALFWAIVAAGIAWRVYIALATSSRAWVDEVWVVLDPAFKILSGAPLEFREHGIRSWVPPAILWVYLKALWLLGIRNGTVVLPLVRLAIAALTCAGIFAFVRAMGKACQMTGAPWLAALVMFFTPELARFASTADLSVLGLPPLLFGLALLADETGKPRRILAAGALLGLAAMIRFQYGVFPACLLAWLLFQRRFWLAAGLFALGAGLLAVDFAFNSWVYGEPILPILNYFRVNAIEGMASGYGTTPFYFGFELLWRILTEPMFVLMILMAPWAMRKMPFFFGSSLLFFLIHCGVDHKEYRFFYGAAALLSGMSAIALQAWLETKPKQAVATAFAVCFVAVAGWRGLKKTAWSDFEIPARLETLAGSQPDFAGLVTYGWGGIHYGGNYTTYSAKPYVFAETRDELVSRRLSPLDYNYLVTGSDRPAPCAAMIAAYGGGALYHCAPAELARLFTR